MNRKKLHKINLLPASSLTEQTTPVTLSYFDQMCQIFRLDPHLDRHATRKMRVWYRPCQKQILMF